MDLKKLIAITIALFSMSIGHLVAQPHYFKHYRVEDGLSNNTIFSVMQDDRGFMWFGSKEGLMRFDGHTFRAYNDPRYPETVRAFVLSIAKAKQGRLWIGTREGVYTFDGQAETFSVINSIPKTETEGLETDEKGFLWVLTGSKLYSYDAVKCTAKKQEIGAGDLVTALTSADGQIWACTLQGYLYRYDAAVEKWSCVNQNQGLRLDRQTRTTRLYVVGHRLYIGSNTGLISFDTRSKTYQPVIDAGKLGYPVFVRDVLRYTEDEFWIATETGIFLYQASSGQLRNLRRNDNDPYSLSDNAVYSLFKDREGGLWACTYFGGISYFHPQLSSFKKYFPGSSENPISGKGVREICRDDYGNLWIGTEDGGLNKLQLNSGKISMFRYQPGRKGISSDNIHGLLARGRELWIGNFERGLDILDIPTGKFIRHYGAEDPAKGLKSNFINVLYQTKKNEIYAGTDQGLYTYVAKKDSFALVPGLPADMYVTSLLEDREERLWVGTIRKGLYCLDSQSGKRENFQYVPGDDNSLSNNMVSGIFQDSRQDYWISTENGGVNRLSHDRKKIEHLGTREGLPSNLVFSTLEDTSGHIWMSTSRGLARFNPVDKTWLVFTQPQGLLTDQFNYNSAFNDHGTFYIGSVGGLISFKPDKLKASTLVPPVYITSFQINNRELSLKDTLVLEHDQSSFSIGFAALTFVAPQITEYLYQMEGLDKNWTLLKNNRPVDFTELSPGTYTFRIKIRGPRQETGKAGKLVIIIRKPYWISNAAVAGYFLITCFMIYFAVSVYYKWIRAKNRRRLERLALTKEKEVYRAKIEFFTNIAHEIRTPLTLIKGPLENVMDEVGEMKAVQKNLQSIERNTERLLSLTNQLLDFRRTESSELSLSYVSTDVPVLLSAIAGSYAGMATEKGLEFRFQLAEIKLEAFMDREAFTKIMDNLINNAMKYAGKTVSLELGADGDFFLVRVVNDGNLIPRGLKEKVFESFYRIPGTEHLAGSGIGLSLARSLAELHGGSLVLEDNDLRLNIFVLRLPVHQPVEFILPDLKN